MKAVRSIGNLFRKSSNSEDNTSNSEDATAQNTPSRGSATPLNLQEQAENNAICRSPYFNFFNQIIFKKDVDH